MKPFEVPQRLLNARYFFDKLEGEASVRARFLLDELEQCHRWLWRVGLLPGDEFKFPREREVIESLMSAALHESNGSQGEAAKLLGISRNTIYLRMRRPPAAHGVIR